MDSGSLRYLFLVIALFIPLLPANAQSSSDTIPVQKHIQTLLTPSLPKLFYPKNKKGVDLLKANRALYASRNYNPIWCTEHGFTSASADLLALLKEEYHNRFLYEKQLDTHYMAVTAAYEKQSKLRVAQVEASLTAAFLYAVEYHKRGLVDPDYTGNQWFLDEKDSIDYAKEFQAFVEKGSVKAYFASLAPEHKQYTALVNHLAVYEDLKRVGAWKSLPDTVSKIKYGQKSTYVPQLRQRLVVTGELAAEFQKGEEYDSTLLKAVQKFQHKFGLNEDGSVGKATLQCMNITVDDLIMQIKVSMERAKWLPEYTEKNYLVANIPDYTLKVYYADSLWRTFRTVVGTKKNQTPCFQDFMENIVVNPSWHVPYSIAKDEIIPVLSGDPNTTKYKNYQVYKSGEGEKVSSTDVDWKDKTAKNNYSFVQPPGPGNSLGQIKFNFPNQHGVYIHDTPSKSYFNRDLRSFSHGCVRLQNPLDLADQILKADQNEWTREKIQEQMKTRQTRTIYLKNKLPIYIIYATCWVNEKGELQLRHDIYGRDAKVYKELVRYEAKPLEKSVK